MKHTYTITGASGNDVVSKIKEIQGITDVEVVAPDRVAITMERHIMSETMNRALAGSGITVTATGEGHMMDKTGYGIKDFYPLIGVFVVVVILTFVLNNYFGSSTLDPMRFFMGSFFVVFGLLKVINLKGFSSAYRMYDVIAKRSVIYSYVYPFFELCLAGLYITNVYPLYTNIFTVILMAASAYGVWNTLRKGEEIMCACLGTVFKVPMTWVTLAEGLLMAVMAGIMIIGLW